MAYLHPRLLGLLLICLVGLAGCGAAPGASQPPAAAPSPAASPTAAPAPSATPAPPATAAPAPSAAASPSAAPALPATVPPAPTSGGQAPILGEAPPDLMELVLADASQRSGVPREAIVVQRAEFIEWPDGALGCPQPGQVYLQVITPGYQIELLADGELYDYRTNDRGFFLLCERG